MIPKIVGSPSPYAHETVEQKRKWTRRPTEQKGKIVFGAGQVIHCVILDYSQGGAKLAVMRGTDAPDEFMLIFADGILRAPCVVRWRTPHPGSYDLIGVEFT